MAWVIGYKVTENEIEHMVVDVDECSPNEHYLYLYNEFEVNEEPDEEGGNVAELKPQKYAKVMGAFPPGSWLFAVHEDLINLAEPV